MRRVYIHCCGNGYLVGASLLAMAVDPLASMPNVPPHREQARSHNWIRYNRKKQISFKAASLLLCFALLCF
ncbi:hypothetical protein [Pseudomonas sp. AF32]|uniref:hypothetical protein n=1 Tax=Pseudomonas sp. AF32 TaxID=554390 RepID=UPI001EEE4C5E|nr:hypothetical protein [Pseudomonas sp. AF32]